VPETTPRPRRISRPKTRWSREFKLNALSRMAEAPDVAALAAELGIERAMLYKWRRKFLAGGPEALHAIGRPAGVSPPFGTALSGPSPLGADADARRIAELERKIGQQQLELDFFRAALRHVGEQRLKQGVSGETTSSR